MEIGVILTASDIPDGSMVTKRSSMVTKRTGKCVYVLQEIVKIYGEHRQEIAQEGIVFLIKHGDPQNISAIPRDTLLVWITTEYEYYNYLSDKRVNTQ